MREKARAPIAIAATVAGLMLLSGSASAAPPANDDFANASPLTLGATASGTTVDSTLEPGEPDYFGSGPGPEPTGSVWYRWTADASPPEHVTAELGDSFGLTVRIYQGDSLGALSPVNTDGGGRFIPQPGVTYRIVVIENFDSSTPFELTFRALEPPVNDDFADAIAIPASLPQTVSGTLTDATRETAEPTHGFNGGSSSVWYSWRPTTAVRAKIDTCDADGPPPFGPTIAVYTGDDLAGLTEVTVTNGGFDCAVSFNASASTTYRIAIAGGGAPFQFTLRQLQPPANDDLADAQVIDAVPQRVEGTLLDATLESGESLHGGGPPNSPFIPDASAWYAWTPSTGGEAVVDGCGTTPTGTHVVAVYTGSSYGGADPLVAAAANSGHCRQVFNASPGTTYRIVVASHREAPFGFDIRMRNRPANDDLAAAQPIASGVPALTTGTTVDATAEPGEPGHGGFPESSVWYRWNSGSGGPVSLRVCREEPGMYASVYTGTSYANLTPVVGANQRCAQRFTAAPNTDYLIAVDSQHVQVPFILALWRTQPPSNDAFAAAQSLSGPGPLAVTGANFDATTEPGESGHSDPFGEKSSVWYAWTAPSSPATRAVTLDTCDSDFRSHLTVYNGTAVSNLTTVARGDGCVEEEGAGSIGRATFTAVANETYRIRVAGFTFQDDEGNFTLRLVSEGVSTPGAGGGGGTVTQPPADPVQPKKKCKKGKKLKKGKCVKKKRKRKPRR